MNLIKQLISYELEIMGVKGFAPLESVIRNIIFRDNEIDWEKAETSFTEQYPEMKKLIDRNYRVKTS